MKINTTHHIHLEILDSENRFGVFIQAEDGGENNICGILVLGYMVGVLLQQFGNNRLSNAEL